MDFMVFINSPNANHQTITDILLPDGNHIKRDGETIDFNPMRKFVGNLFIFVVNGVPDPKVRMLKSVGFNEQGVGVFSYDDVTSHK